MYFLGPQDVVIRGDSYPTRHDVLGGPFPIYFAPIERGADGRYVLESIFT
jgi:hypothetical protein